MQCCVNSKRLSLVSLQFNAAFDAIPGRITIHLIVTHSIATTAGVYPAVCPAEATGLAALCLLPLVQATEVLQAGKGVGEGEGGTASSSWRWEGI